MGCMTSSPRIHAAHNARPILDFDEIDDIQQGHQKVITVDVSNYLKTSYSNLLQGITKIPKTPSIQPIACLNECTTPLVLDKLYLTNGDSTDVTLPVAAFGVYGKGKTVMIGHIGLLAECTQTSTEASAFLENISRYVCGMNRMTIKVLILGVTTNTANNIKKNLAVFEIYADISKDPVDNWRNYAGVICTTECTLSTELLNYVQRGGGLICGFVESSNLEEPSEYPMQKILLELGYGIPECSLQIGSSSSNSIKTECSFSTAHKVTFPSLVETYIKRIEDPNSINMSDYDSLVTALRYNIISMMRTENNSIKQLNEAAWNFLDSTEASSPESTTVGSQLIHGITYVLISEMMSHIPAIYFENLNRSWPFPGECGENLELADFKTHVELHCDSWFSTGLYLPPGVVSTATLEHHIPHISVQIGAHKECILSNSGPWKRWPIVTAVFDFSETTINIASPFGGIVYIVAENVDIEEKIDFEITFRNIGRHTSFLTSVPDSFEESRDMKTPWGEIETQFVIFTLPTSKMDMIADLQDTCDFIDSIVARVLTFTSDESLRLFRVVFDVELNEGSPVLGYPIVFDISMIDGILMNNSEPSTELFLFLTYIGMMSMPTGIFEHPMIESFATIAAIHAFKNTWKNCDPLQYSLVAPPELFEVLYRIYNENNKNALVKAFLKAREASVYPNQNSISLWKIFVQKLSLDTQDYSHELLKESFSMQSISGHMIMTYSSTSLNTYQLTEALASATEIV
ncbi:hypothetical protein TRFO_18905 [Tritrichomonas foetus]|uniref:Peptidase M60 domain-containing protein n=1 Tax=Tritrichomonas foetus TaxID=1144522 RepID=A0A1J4KK03_9EUKA|nr:hypothetical protein TRFO_18905 [Tritrichomonas foetus]|eukprot:OHT11555.1 hypothetical protein TRFO_18905 [Tritrichomonas foetus]